MGFETISENVFASSQFLFSELEGNDIDDWLSNIFSDLKEQLPTIYQSNISLDLIDDEISFVFPQNTLPGSGFIENGSTDINVSTSVEIEAESVPEADLTLSFLILGTFGVCSTLLCKKKEHRSAMNIVS